MEKKGISHTCKIEVRYSETDAMGVVHHGSYPIWFEQARIDFFKAIGAPYTEIEKEGFESPVLELVVKYRKACRFGAGRQVQVEIQLQGLREGRALHHGFHAARLYQGRRTHRREARMLQARGKPPVP